MPSSFKVQKLSISSPVPNSTPKRIRSFVIVCLESEQCVAAFWETIAQRGNTAFGIVRILEKKADGSAFDIQCSIICRASVKGSYEALIDIRATFKTSSKPVEDFLASVKDGSPIAIAIGFPWKEGKRIDRSRLIIANDAKNISREHRQLLDLYQARSAGKGRPN